MTKDVAVQDMKPGDQFTHNGQQVTVKTVEVTDGDGAPETAGDYVQVTVNGQPPFLLFRGATRAVTRA